MSTRPVVDNILLERYFNDQCTEEESQVVWEWLSNPENKLLAREFMERQWVVLESERDPSFEIEKSLARTREKGAFDSEILSDGQKRNFLHNRKVTPLMWKIAAAWSCLLLLSLSGLIFLMWKGDDKQFAYDNRTKVESSSGEIVLRVLSDGTKIWLNAQSSLSFPTSFAGDSMREVWLNGEAFFDVAEDKEHPFIVRTKGVNIRVLGTAFNVKSYDGDSTVKTTLVRGKVVIENKNGNVRGNIELKPNQQAIFSHLTEQITLRDVHVEKHTSWSSGSLVFEDDNLYDVIRSLERWYGVTIHVEDKSNMECRLTARIDKESLVETLETLELLTDVRYSINGKDVFIAGKICQQ